MASIDSKRKLDVCADAEHDAVALKLSRYKRTKRSARTTLTDSCAHDPVAHSGPIPLTTKTCLTSSNQPRLTGTDFDKPCVELARYLLNKTFVRMDGERRLSGRIVETEAYLGGDDKASHSYAGKRTARNEAMYMSPGTAYVYNIYGMYTCVNISSRGDGAAVLIRSLEPLDGVDTMELLRSKGKLKKLKDREFCNGPSKLTQALGITKANGNQVDLTTSNCMWIEQAPVMDQLQIVSTSRIGIGNYAEEWTEKLLRYYIKESNFVSVKEKRVKAKA